MLESLKTTNYETITKRKTKPFESVGIEGNVKKKW